MPKDLKRLAKMIKLDQGHLEAQRKPREPRTKQINQLFRPERVDLNGCYEKDKPYRNPNYYHHPALAQFKWTNAFAGHTATKRDAWFDYGFSVEILNELDPAQQYFQLVADQMRNALERANWYDEVLAFIGDGGADGVAFMEPIHDLDLDEARFQTEHPGDVWISRDKYGRINRVHTRKKMTAQNAVEAFKDSEHYDNLPEALIQNVESATGNPLTEYTFIHARYKNPDRRTESILSEDKEYTNVWLCESNSEIVELNGVDDMILEWNPNLSSRNTYGTGLAAMALNTAITGDTYEKKKLQIAAFAAEPRYKASKKMKTHIDRRPGATLYMDNTDDYQKIDDSTGYEIAKDQMTETDKLIDSWFLLDLFLAMSNIDNPKDVVAFYFSQLQGEKALILTSTLTAYEQFLDASHAFVWRIEENAGRMPEMPDELLAAIEEYEEEHPGIEVSVTPNYIGPLFQIQREFVKAGPLAKGIDFMDRVMDKFPETKDKIDGDVLLEKGLDAFKFSQEAINTDAEVGEIREARAIQAQQEKEEEAAKFATENLDKLGSEVNKNSVLGQAVA